MPGLSGSMHRLILIWVLVTVGVPARAGDWFIEGALGASPTHLTRVEYDDPIGSMFTPNSTNGTRIIPHGLTRGPWSHAAAASFGYLFDRFYFLRTSYRHFGARAITANGLFFYNPMDLRQISPSFSQAMRTSADGFFVGVGVECELGDEWFFDGSLEGGAALVRAEGTRDVGSPIEQPFPSRNRANLSYGAGLSVGRRLTPQLALELMMNWNSLGRTETGRAPDIGAGPNFVKTPGVRADASMTAMVKAASIMLGLRQAF
jgi:hypothetical protein